MKRKLIGILACMLVSLSIISCNSNNKISSKNNQDKKDEILEKVENVKKVEVEYLDNSVLNDRRINISEKSDNILFNKNYSDIEGVFTFRGNSYRTAPSYGSIESEAKSIKQAWRYTTSSSSWGGGAGWTGQAAVVKWPTDIKKNMNLTDDFKSKEGGVELIQASLDGNIYFLDSETGKPTREKIRVGNPIKGSVSIDPRGIPLLYVGEGINESGIVGFNIYSLIDGKKLYEIDGRESDAPRAWGAFDSSAIVSAETDSVIAPGENGIIYKIKLNSKYDKEKGSIEINPEIGKYIYNSGPKLGVENSIAIYANLGYFADNNGMIQCIDLNTMKPVWSISGNDDIDATLTIDIENDTPFIYCGDEVDHQGSTGVSKLEKIDGITGKVIWEKEFKCESLVGENPVNGGLLSTPAVGKNNMSDKVVFSLSRYNGFSKGLLVALNKKTGNIDWQIELDNYAWSLPTDFYDKDGNGYIIQGDSAGKMFLINGQTGKVINTIQLDANIEASPVIFNDNVFVATRNSSIYGLKIK